MPMQPSPIAETVNPCLPSRRCSMCLLLVKFSGASSDFREHGWYPGLPVVFCYPHHHPIPTPVIIPPGGPSAAGDRPSTLQRLPEVAVVAVEVAVDPREHRVV